jgi:hypothetical protein
LSNPIEVPSPAELDEIDRRESQAIESLEISNDPVKCQKCSIALPLLSKKTLRSKGNRIYTLRTRIKWMENYSRVSNINDLQQLKQELADLLEEEAKADKLRSLPLYSSKITGYRFACSDCFTKAYGHRR